MYCTSNGQIPGQIFESGRSWSVTECKMPKMRKGCIWFIDLNNLLMGRNSSNIKKKQTLILLSQSEPKFSSVLLNVSLSVGAPVRVYLHSLVRRLLYSHLTPSTLSSPSLPPVLSPPVHSHPDSPSPPTTSLHGWLCLVLRSMHVCCLAWQTPQIESLSSLPPWATEARRRPDSLPSENDPTCRGSHSWGWQGTVHKHSCIGWTGAFYFMTLKINANLEYRAAQNWKNRESLGNILPLMVFDWICLWYFVAKTCRKLASFCSTVQLYCVLLIFLFYLVHVLSWWCQTISTAFQIWRFAAGICLILFGYDIIGYVSFLDYWSDKKHQFVRTCYRYVIFT